MDNFYERVRRMLYRWFCRRSQKTGMNWHKFQLYLKRNPLPRGRITVNVYDVRPGFLSYIW
jgi:RNA-directed DNA polymerase